MVMKEDEFLERLLATFRIEAQEHLQAISSELVILEKTQSPGDEANVVEAVLREIHSLKGAARAVDRREIEAVCQRLESIFALWKRCELSISSGLFDVLYRAVDVLEQLLAHAGEKDRQPMGRPIEGTLKELEGALVKFRAVSQPEEAPTAETAGPRTTQTPQREVPAPRQVDSAILLNTPKQFECMQEAVPHAQAELVKVPTAKLDDLMRQCEEMIGCKLAAQQRARDLREMAELLTLWRKEWSKIQPEIRRSMEKGKHTPRQSKRGGQGRTESVMGEFLEWSHDLIQSLEASLFPLEALAQADSRTLSGMVDNLLDDVKSTLMLPLSSLLESFPKLVRDLSREQGKQVDLIIRGGETEIDKRILQELKDPLIHIVRNCIDHGMETVENREKNGKPPRGSISITIRQKDSGKVEIVTADDGMGIDLDRVRTSAVKHGLASGEEIAGMSEEEALRLIFRSGISTSPMITSISGRGLGLAIVQEKVEKLGGTLVVESEPGYGTVFRIVVPITLATFRGTLVRIGERVFVVPTTNLERAARVDREAVRTVENRETVELKGEVIPLILLSSILEIKASPGNANDPGRITVIALKSGQGKIAFCVDEVMSEQEVLVKGLGKQLSRVRNISGAAILGDGRVAPILNVSDLFKSAAKVSGSIRPVRTDPGKAESASKNILVVEDSITARTLLRSILESAGYRVKTAVDGVQGFSTLQAASFDLVVSDVEMPKMDGFALTARIRSSEAFRNLPVILVTALESEEDRKRGIDVGANAYLVKSSFDQSNLIEVIRRLI